MKIKFRKPFRNPFVLLIYYISIVLIATYFLKTYRCNKTEFIKCTNCYSFKDQWNNIKNNSSINKDAKVYDCWLKYDNSNSKLYPQVRFITQNKFGRFQYVYTTYENDKIKLEFNGTGENLKDKIDNCISTDKFVDNFDLVYNNRHKLFKTPGYKYTIFANAKFHNFGDKYLKDDHSNLYLIDKSGNLIKIAQKDFPLKHVIYIHCEKSDKNDNCLEDICIIFK